MNGAGTPWRTDRTSLAGSMAQARPFAPQTTSLLRYSPWDALLVALALAHGALLLLAPSVWVIALGLWWNANTVSHNFIHLPFFRSRTLNALFSAYLSLLLGFPQSLWRERHLAHHRGSGVQWRLKVDCIMEGVLVLCLWLILLGMNPWLFATVYMPGWLAGLALCHLQGHFEHVRGTISHYGRLYNWLFFNDGFHVEHHAKPARHWTQLSLSKPAENTPRKSRWPAVLRWLELFSLDGLERLVLRWPCLQSFVLQRHEQAFRQLLPLLPPLRRVTIVGGGLFPRTAFVLRRIAPGADLRIVDGCAANLEQARALLNGSVIQNERKHAGASRETPNATVMPSHVHQLESHSLTGSVDFACEFYEASPASTQIDKADLVVIPLAFVGDRSAIYRCPPARNVLVHDWLWRKRGGSVVISILLLKRLNLIRA